MSLAAVGGRAGAWAGAALPRWRRRLRRAGLPGALGTLLLLGALALIVITVPRAKQALAADERALYEARLEAAAQRRLQNRPAEVLDPLRRFGANFPVADERHRRVDHLLALAAGLGLQPRRSDLRSLPEAELGLTRVRLVLPLSGSYEQLRRFVEQALREDPALSLDTLRLERADSQANELRAELQWSLWMRSADATVARAAR